MPDNPSPPLSTLRQHRPDDLAWVVEAHGRLYAAEYGWNDDFRRLVADVVATFERNFDPARECCFIAEQDGVRLGCAFVAAKDARTAQLRCVLLEPQARGQRLGSRLVDACIDFARAAGYADMVLWTNDCLHAARAIYQRAGFELESQEAHHSFGHDLVGQYWRLTL